MLCLFAMKLSSPSNNTFPTHWLEYATIPARITSALIACTVLFSIYPYAFPPNHSIEERPTIISYPISQSQSIPQRCAQLEEELSQEGLELRKDSQFCKEFIEKPLCIEVEEVVAIMEITSDLFLYGHIAWSNLHSEMEVRGSEASV
ncbi:hypothetical protein BCR33DRAFT_802474 [Rhizoclosmatium globosum]|uniref:Uncharacterized protein n=1 Tax=Rhizoclosmatium globosum TaxID=329046 RepID=A0A1Y2AYS4_9FUNG|nr:hypothetical protein BCR33DRAFT_802474 [Rhizoclosmatium globosum]|eukprot:ORY27722.1 hypothetical protein BCR33DRAFT_802474 [Rhizoclosmatium globosum]